MSAPPVIDTSVHPKTAESTTRRWWRYRPRRRLTCPDGHHFKERSKFNESGFQRCEHWIGGEHRECGRWVFIYAIRGGGCIVAEVSLDEQDEMDDLSTPAQMIEYLGIWNADESPAAHPPAGSPDHHHRRRG